MPHTFYKNVCFVEAACIFTENDTTFTILPCIFHTVQVVCMVVCMDAGLFT